MADPEGVDELLVEGYSPCKCGAWVPHGSDGKPRALCADCRSKIGEAVEASAIRYEIEGRVLTAKPRKKRGHRPKRKTPTQEQRENRQRADRAKIRALWRLSRIYLPMYEILLAEERIREGLPATATKARPRPKAIADQLLADVDDATARYERDGERLRQGA